MPGLRLGGGVGLDVVVVDGDVGVERLKDVVDDGSWFELAGGVYTFALGLLLSESRTILESP